MSNGSTKIFGIGLSKTATTSLAQAMAILGYKVRHSPRKIDDIAGYDFTNDISVAWRYRFLHHVFPHARFILTVRDINSWLKSCERHFRDVSKTPPLRRLENRFMCFGRTDFDRHGFRLSFEKHNADVVHHFGSSPGSLLVLNICGGDDWKKLCPFLQKQIPSQPFPFLNRTTRVLETRA